MKDKGSWPDMTVPKDKHKFAATNKNNFKSSINSGEQLSFFLLLFTD